MPMPCWHRGLSDNSMLIDTHAHIYTEQFAGDLKEVITRAQEAGVGGIMMPNIDSGSIESMLEVARAYPGLCYPMMGLHPSSVGENYGRELDQVTDRLANGRFYGIGEIGIDLYWDKTYQSQQEDAFRQQLRLARTLKLPVVIHMRESFLEVYAQLEKEQDGSLTGIFHCFSGDAGEARKVIDAGFYLGIGGVITYKNSTLSGVLEKTGPERVVLETDSPWLSPVPHRGKRNEPVYLMHIVDRLANVFGLTPGEVADITTANARSIFRI